MENNVIQEKSKNFAIRIVNIHKYLSEDKHEYVLSKQLLKSGTSIGANIYEAKYGQTKGDFISKMSIALKEASETDYWLEILVETDYITKEEYESIQSECKELIKILTSIVRSTKGTT